MRLMALAKASGVRVISATLVSIVVKSGSSKYMESLRTCVGE